MFKIFKKPNEYVKLSIFGIQEEGSWVILTEETNTNIHVMHLSEVKCPLKNTYFSGFKGFISIVARTWDGSYIQLLRIVYGNYWRKKIIIESMCDSARLSMVFWLRVYKGWRFDVAYRVSSTFTANNHKLCYKFIFPSQFISYMFIYPLE